MCGITGIKALSEEGKKYLSRTSASVYKLFHRGPDGEGIKFFPNLALGHRRLSIIDPGQSSAQPFSDSSGRYWLTYNGEFFNYREVRKELQSKGISFATEGDTEVLFQLLIAEGIDGLKKVRGFFAFAFYDAEKDTLLIARDRFGIKPLWYFSDSDKFAFSSELKALEEFGLPSEINRDALFSYFHFNYIPGPATIWEGVKKLEPGCYIQITGTTISQGRYYSISSDPFSGNYNDAVKNVRNLLEQAVSEQLVSDVPLGCFLSGGLDSSIVAGIASSQIKNLNTFSIGFKDSLYFDETYFAETAAKKFKTNHHSIQLTTKDLFDVIDETLESFDEPFADSSAIAVNILSRETRKKVTVSLSGDGADEIFGGYNKHRAELSVIQGGWKNNAVAFAGPLTSLIKGSRNNKAFDFLRKVNRYYYGLKLSPQDRYLRWAGLTDNGKQVLGLLVKKQGTLLYPESINKITGKDLNEILQADLDLVLPYDMLVKTDLMSMSRSLEIRPVFLDHRIVEFAASLPWNFKITSGKGKIILRDAFKDILPEEVLSRSKHGFEVPLSLWIRKELKGKISDLLLNKKLLQEQNLFSPEFIDKLVRQAKSDSPGDATSMVWALIVFQSWWVKKFR